jgi:hypothetical protein
MALKKGNPPLKMVGGDFSYRIDDEIPLIGGDGKGF